MALVKCKECGNDVSNKAKVCPSCGVKVPKKVGVLGWLFVCLFVLPLAWGIGSNIGKPDKAAGQNSSAQSVASDTPAEKWSRTEHSDAMTDKKTVVLSANSKNSTLFEFPYQKRGGSKLSLNFRRKGNVLDAYLLIEKGQMQCHRSDCSFSLRVADGPIQKWTGLPSTTNDSDLMFVRDAEQLETIVKSGKPFRIGMEFFQAGERVFEFEPEGYPGI